MQAKGSIKWIAGGMKLHISRIKKIVKKASIQACLINLCKQIQICISIKQLLIYKIDIHTVDDST